jgi:DNA-binding MarR family transcriptional regulator
MIIEEKILSALERLHTVTRSSLQKAGQQQGLSPLHARILHRLQSGPQTISSLASQFRISKPTVSDSVAVLLMRKFVKKYADENDGRSHKIGLTPAGEKEASLLGAYAAPFLQSVGQMDDLQKQALWAALLNLLKIMQAQGLIPHDRMCSTCNHFQETGDGGYCKLMQVPLVAAELRIDCPEHERAA